MNEGWIAVLIILGVIASVIWIAIHRDVIYEPSPVQAPRRVKLATRQAKQAKQAPKQAATVSAPVSGITTPDIDAEMIALRALAKCVRAGAMTQTDAICIAFDVKAGSSKAYQRLVEKYRVAAAELDQSDQADQVKAA